MSLTYKNRVKMNFLLLFTHFTLQAHKKEIHLFTHLF